MMELEEVEAVKARMRRMWDMGDYGPLSQRLEPAARELADACAVSAGQEVLDVAAGDGNFALACAREGASVVASDLAPGMVERGRARSEREGYEIEWIEADAEDLPFEDARFDCVGSVFGAMIAPRPERVATELFRVVRPGNTVGMTAWVPGGFFAGLFALGRRFSPPRRAPRGRRTGATRRSCAIAARSRGARRVRAQHARMDRRLARGARGRAGQEHAAFVAAREGLPPDAFEQLRGATLELIHRRNVATDGSLRLDAEYLITVARRRG